MKDDLKMIFNWCDAISSSWSYSCRAASTDLPDPLSQLISIVHCSREAFKAISAIVYRYSQSRPAFACSCEGIHRNISLMSSSLLLQQCPACLIRLTWIVPRWVVGGLIAAVFGSVPLGLVQYCLQHSCVIAFKLFIHPCIYIAVSTRPLLGKKLRLI